MPNGDAGRRHLLYHVLCFGKAEVVRAAIYANGAGKSNLVKALDLLREAATSERIPNEKISPFKLSKPEGLPYPHIEIEVFQNKNYLYGLSLIHNRVVEEGLFLRIGVGKSPMP